MTVKPPKPEIPNAPGLRWYPRLVGWEARWRARPDLVERGFRPRSVGLWRGDVPTKAEIGFIQSTCDRLQAEMLVWGRGGLPGLTPFDGTIRSLVRCYETDPDSDYHKLRFQSRKNTNYRNRCMVRDHGDQPIGDTMIDGIERPGIDARMIKRWHEAWSAGGKIATGHGMITGLRTLMGFGATYFKPNHGGNECARVRGLLSMMKFENTKPRTVWLTAEHAIAIRAEAHKQGLPSIALAQALQFELALRQKDVIGEWVPTSEPGMSDVTAGNDKWMRGLRWSEIDRNLILRHSTSKSNSRKDVEVDLRLAPMVMEELAHIVERPESGPVIIFENTSTPYFAHQFRREWVCIARAAGIPREIKNMDSRAGAITESDEAGMLLQDTQQMATHSDSKTTQGYSRSRVKKVAKVMQARIDHRNKK